jgi:3-oxoacyl-[acyl-carrier protein] reductase
MTQTSILITGGAGGIGAASARELARRGYAVVIADLDADLCTAIAKELTSAGGLATGIGLDVTDPAAADVALEAAAALAPLSAVVNSAGIVHQGTLDDVTPAEWERVLAINLTGTFTMCKAAAPRLAANGGGALVNLASTAGRTASTFSSPAYVASKAGVIGLTMSLARQLAESGVRVNAVAPGIIDTAMIQGYGPERIATLVAGIPVGRMGTAEEVATTIAYLATDESSYVTGQTIAINGGTFIS